MRVVPTSCIPGSIDPVRIKRGGGGRVEFRAFSLLKLLKITLKEVLEVLLEVLEVVLIPSCFFLRN